MGPASPRFFIWAASVNQTGSSSLPVRVKVPQGLTKEPLSHISSECDAAGRRNDSSHLYELCVVAMEVKGEEQTEVWWRHNGLLVSTLNLRKQNIFEFSSESYWNINMSIFKLHVVKCERNMWPDDERLAGGVSFHWRQPVTSNLDVSDPSSCPAEFWGDIAKDFYWKSKHTGQFLDYNFDVTKGEIFIKCMDGASTNICYNLLDRNVHERKLGDKVAFHWWVWGWVCKARFRYDPVWIRPGSDTNWFYSDPVRFRPSSGFSSGTVLSSRVCVCVCVRFSSDTTRVD